MVTFNFVVFGFTGNLSQLKIIPALYALEAKNILSKGTKIIGVGRKDIVVEDYVKECLGIKNNYHPPHIDEKVVKRLNARCQYVKGDVENEDGPIYKELQKQSGNMLYYFATYPALYPFILDNFKKFNLNNSQTGWVRLMIEKPIGDNFESSVKINDLLSGFLTDKQIFRVDHYLGKESLRDVFGKITNSKDVEKIEVSMSESFGIGKRGGYYDSVGALLDVGQNHLLQMVAAAVAKSYKKGGRAKVIQSLVPDPGNIVFGQYEGYLSEEGVKPDSSTDTFFALKAHISEGLFKDVPVYIWSGKKLSRDETKIAVYYKSGRLRLFKIFPLVVPEKYAPYERLVIEAVKGDLSYFVSREEVEASWKFIDSLRKVRGKPLIYNPGSTGPEAAEKYISNEENYWV